MASRVGIYIGRELGAYGYEEKPWFRPHERLEAFLAELRRQGLDREAALIEAPPASDADLFRFHTPAHVERVRRLCARNEGALDHGPTLARETVEVAATHVVGAVMDACRRLLAGELRRAFVPIAGFHHAHAGEARSYCLYNDCAVALSFLSQQGLAGPIAYVDIDAHHGDGVYAAFAGDPRVVVADIHEDGRTLWPNSPASPGAGPVSGERSAAGEGAARGTKLNLPLRAGATDADFLEAWAEVEAFVDGFQPAFVVFEGGADCLAGDPLAHLALSPASLRHAAARLSALADRHAGGRLLVLGGGGYDARNLAAGWCAVVASLLAPAPRGAA
ncbi:acetoin utilization protein AcuC [Sorangium sp. So ce131]|uniref:acetoin utilization protein AcuC n=1 Tax=Sorangium sp. So ce131 TaxID=3133282 RepID=UPI003F6476D9